MVVSPIPPEVFMPLAGFLASQGKLNLGLVVLVGTVSFVISVLPWYLIGRFIGKWGIQKLPSRYRKLFSLTPERLEQANQWFRHRGGTAILISFLLPGMRNLVWVPAGISGVRLSTALLYLCGGGLVYIGLIAYAGFLLGNQYYLVRKYFISVYHFVLVVLGAALVIWGIKWVIQLYLKRRELG